MDYFLRHERRRLIEDLIHLQHEEDRHRQYQSFLRNYKKLDRYESDFEDDESRNYQNRQKEYCLVKLIYRNSNSREQHLDEIMIIQHNQTVFKGCLQSGDKLTFKSKRYRNELKIKLKFYINDLFEDEMIACCEHGLINKYQSHYLFQIVNIFGSKPCYHCENNDNNVNESISSSPISSSRSKSLKKTKPHSSNESNGQKSKQRRSISSKPQIYNHNILRKNYSDDITDVSDYPKIIQKQYNNKEQFEDESSDILSSNPQLLSKRIYGPPQLASMISITESVDLPSPDIHEQTNENLIDLSSNIQPTSKSHLNSNIDYNKRESIRSNEDSPNLESRSSNIETNPNEQETQTNLNNANDLIIANDATQLLLTRLGIMRQQQVEHSETSFSNSPREKGNVENFILIYLHNLYPDEIIIKNLRNLVNFLKIFNDIDDCIAYINTISNEKIILILSNLFYNSIFSRIIELQQIFSIYIICENKYEIDLSVENQRKIQGIYTNINDIYEQILNIRNQITRDLIIYLNMSSNSLSIEPIVEYFQLLNEIILDNNGMKYDLKELINFSRYEYDGNDEELKIIDEFEKTYKKKQAIYWFSRQCFLSKMLNKALRIPEADILFRLRLFIQDLYQQIKNESILESITVYLAQTIQRNDLDDLYKNILNNNLITFPQFLFGTTDKIQAIHIAKELPILNDDCIPLLIRIDIPENFKCANMNSHQYSIDNDNNILLNIGIIGRIIKIEKENNNENHIASIHIELINFENEQNIQQILNIKRTEIKSFSTFVSLIKLMIIMKQQTSAKQFTQTMYNDDNLKTDSNIQGAIAASFHILATSYRDQEDYKHAVELYLLSLNTFIRIISPNAVELSTLYNYIGAMYFRLEDYDKSLEYHQKAVNVQIHSNTPDLYSVSNYSNSIGIIYLKQEKYSQAIISFERTIKILQQIPDLHDYELALTYDNIGDTYLSQAKYEDALNNYRKSLEIQERIIPRKIQNLASSYHTIGNIYLKLGQSHEALIHLKRALEYEQEYLPLTHPTFALLYNNIGLMYYREEQYSEALQCYTKSLEIAAISLPENHSMIGITLFNIALIYSNQEKFDEAIESIEKSTKQFLKTLSSDHPDVIENQIYMESIKRKKILKEIFDENSISF